MLMIARRFLTWKGKRQSVALKDRCMRNPNSSYDRLGELKMSVLVANGDNDLLVST